MTSSQLHLHGVTLLPGVRSKYPRRSPSSRAPVAALCSRAGLGSEHAPRRRPLQVLQAHCLRARRQHDLLVPPVGVHPYERVAQQLLPRGRCPCRRRGAPNRGAATAPSCPRRSRPMAPPPWRSGTLPRSVWSARGMAVEVRTARCRRWRRRPEPGADGIRFTVQGMWTVPR